MENGNKYTVNNRKYLLAILIIGAVLMIGGTLSYFWDLDQAGRLFRGEEEAVESIEVHLIEPAWVSNDQGKGMKPGDIVPADPSIVNTKEPVYMRVRIRFVDPDSGKVIKGKRAENIWSLICYREEAEESQQYNTSFFTYDEESSSLEAGNFFFWYTHGSCIFYTGETAVLYNYVVIPQDWGRKEISSVGNFNVHIEGEALHYKSYSKKAGETPIENAAQAFELLKQNSLLTETSKGENKYEKK